MKKQLRWQNPMTGGWYHVPIPSSALAYRWNEAHPSGMGLVERAVRAIGRERGSGFEILTDVNDNLIPPPYPCVRFYAYIDCPLCKSPMKSLLPRTATLQEFGLFVGNVLIDDTNVDLLETEPFVDLRTKV